MSTIYDRLDEVRASERGRRARRRRYVVIGLVLYAVADIAASAVTVWLGWRIVS